MRDLGSVHVYSLSQVRLEQMWQLGRRVVLTVGGDSNLADQQTWVWPPLRQAWANAQHLHDLRSYLDHQVRWRVASGQLWAAMLHLTPTMWDILLRPDMSFRSLAHRVNPHITRWLRRRWAHRTNIAASDFFRGNDVINIAIRYSTVLSGQQLKSSAVCGNN